MLHIRHDAVLSNRFRADGKECFVIFGGFGDLGSERAMLRSETRICVCTDGGVIEVPLDPHALGEGGKVGMCGRLVSSPPIASRHKLHWTGAAAVAQSAGDGDRPSSAREDPTLRLVPLRWPGRVVRYGVVSDQALTDPSESPAPMTVGLPAPSLPLALSNRARLRAMIDPNGDVTMTLVIVGGVGAGMSAVRQALRIDPAAEILALLVAACRLGKALG